MGRLASSPTPSSWPRNWLRLGLWPTTRTFSEAELSRKQALELGEGCGGGEGVGDEDLLLVASLGGDELGGLLGALEGARDDEIEVELEGVEDVRELEALGLAVLVEGTLEVEERIGARTAGAGVAKDK